MNRSIDSTSLCAWNQIKTRTILALGGVALAASLVSGGFALGRTTAATQDATVLSRSSAVAQTQFANAADAEDAGRAIVVRSAVVEPMFATAADAEHAARSLVSVPAIVRSKPVTQQFGSAADAEYAARSMVSVPELASPQPLNPMFATEADAEFASRALAPESGLR